VAAFTEHQQRHAGAAVSGAAPCQCPDVGVRPRGAAPEQAGVQQRVGGDLAFRARGVTSLLAVIRYKPFKVRLRRPGPALPVALAAVGSALALAACGSSGKPGGGAGPATASGGIAYADCMRAHGVSNFPDPSSAGGGVQLSGSAIDTQSPAFQSAQSACEKLLPGGLPGRGGGSATRIKHGVEIAACMRTHGLRSFPDPTTSPPSTLPAPDETILGGPDGVFSLSASIFESPAFKQAAAACGFPLPGRGFTMPVAAPGG
jgi:hypothetical protein